jgi:hypothetical protein
MLLMFVVSTIRLSAQGANTVNYYVAPNGQQGNPGTIDRPFQRPEQALQAVSGLSGATNATIYVRAGSYPFKQTLTVTGTGAGDSKHITITNYQSEKVSFTGSQKLDPGKFVVVSDGNILKRLPSVARGKVYQIDLKAAGVNDFGRMAPHGYKNVLPSPLELFYNGKTLPLARYPNEGFLPIGEVSDHGDNKTHRGAVFQTDDSHIRNWGTADQAWVCGYFANGYSDDNMQVASFDGGSRTIHTKDPALYGVYSSTDVSTNILKNAKGVRGFYVYNLLEELDQPGEWFLDAPTGILYLWPADNAITTADVEVSMLRTPILTATNTSNFTVKGITFAYGRTTGISLDGTTGTIISDCVFNGLGTVGITTAGPDNKPLGNTGLFIRACTFEHTGTGGVILVGGVRKTLTPGNDIVDNCTFTDYSRRNLTYCPAVWLIGVGNQVTHCDIQDAPGQAIIFYGNDLVIAYNHIKHVLYHITDAGAVYTGRDPSTTGNSITSNYFENIGSDLGASTTAIYLDDGTSGTEVDNNIFDKCGTGGTYNFGAVHINGGTENTLKNNQFIDCQRAYSHTPWKDQDWKDLISNPGKRSNPDIDMRSDVFLKKYPYLKAIDDTVNLAKRENHTYNTVMVRTPELGDGQGMVNNNAVKSDAAQGVSEARSKIGRKEK